MKLIKGQYLRFVVAVVLAATSVTFGLTESARASRQSFQDFNGTTVRPHLGLVQCPDGRVVVSRNGARTVIRIGARKIAEFATPARAGAMGRRTIETEATPGVCDFRWETQGGHNSAESTETATRCVTDDLNGQLIERLRVGPGGVLIYTHDQIDADGKPRVQVACELRVQGVGAATGSATQQSGQGQRGSARP
jgi:hypothetical protein